MRQVRTWISFPHSDAGRNCGRENARDNPVGLQRPPTRRPACSNCSRTCGPTGGASVVGQLGRGTGDRAMRPASTVCPADGPARPLRDTDRGGYLPISRAWSAPGPHLAVLSAQSRERASHIVGFIESVCAVRDGWLLLSDVAPGAQDEEPGLDAPSTRVGSNHIEEGSSSDSIRARIDRAISSTG